MNDRERFHMLAEDTMRCFARVCKLLTLVPDLPSSMESYEDELLELLDIVERWLVVADETKPKPGDKDYVPF